MKRPNRPPLCNEARPSTFTGLRYDPAYFTLGDVRLEDIGRALSNICRYNGAIKCHYSVAQHSVILAHVVPALLNQRGHFPPDDFEYLYHAHACAALMHDASEAYMADYIAPIKDDMSMAGVPVRELEQNIQTKIFSYFGMDISLLETVEEFDKRITENEKDFLYLMRETSPQKYPPLDGVQIEKWTPEFAYEKFMQTAHQLEIDEHGLPH